MICLFLDAFKPEYVKYTRYIKELTKNSLYGELEVPVGFTSILASFFTGCYPDKHGVIDIFEKEEKPKKKISNKWIVSFLNLLKNKRFFYTPLKLKEKKYFKSILTKAWVQKGCLKIPTLFDVLEKNNISFTVIDWPNYYVNRRGGIFFDKSMKKAMKLAKHAKTKFVFVHFLDLDDLAHKYGVDSPEVIKKIKEIDNAVEVLSKKDKDLLIFSDHGMDNVEKSYNLKKRLDESGLKYGKDYIYFMGSTLARFWFNNKSSEEKIRHMLLEDKNGEIIDFKEYHLPKTCDLIFLAKFKTVFYPNFYNSTHRAMHGWSPKIQKAFYLISRESKKKQNAEIIDLLPHILKTLNLPQIRCDGSLII